MSSLAQGALALVGLRFKEPALLDRVKVGDKVKFRTEKVGGAFMVTKID